MKDLNVIVDESTSLVYPDKKTIGNEYENLQGKIIFKFKKEFINGIGWLEMKLPDGTAGFLNLTKENEEYSLPIKSSLLKNQGKIYMQLRITEDENENGIPVFKSNIFYVEVKESLNVTDEIPDQYESWLDVANEKLLEFETAIAEVERININAERTETGAIVEVTDKEGNTKTTNINDGYTPKKGVDYFTSVEINEFVDMAKYDDTSIRHEIEQINDLTEQLDKDITNIDNRVTGLNEELTEQEETINHLADIKADKAEIPDVSEFIKKTVNDLVNYYKKSETYTQTEVKQLIGAIKTAHFEVVENLPVIGENNIIYLVPKTITKENDIYEEYIYVNEFYEFIGSTAVDLTGYATENWVNNQGFLKEHQSLKDYALKAELPTKTSDLDNDSNFINQTQMEQYIDSLNGNEVLY